MLRLKTGKTQGFRGYCLSLLLCPIHKRKFSSKHGTYTTWINSESWNNWWRNKAATGREMQLQQGVQTQTLSLLLSSSVSLSVWPNPPQYASERGVKTETHYLLPWILPGFLSFLQTFQICHHISEDPKLCSKWPWFWLMSHTKVEENSFIRVDTTCWACFVNTGLGAYSLWTGGGKLVKMVNT